MTKSELITKLVEQNLDLSRRDVERIVNCFFDTITKALSEGHRVELRGFGTFSVRHRGARQGRNPRTGQSVSVEEKNVPFFKMGKSTLGRLNRR